LRVAAHPGGRPRRRLNGQTRRDIGDVTLPQPEGLQNFHFESMTNHHCALRGLGKTEVGLARPRHPSTPADHGQSGRLIIRLAAVELLPDLGGQLPNLVYR
jgi:hypothetical protein